MKKYVLPSYNYKATIVTGGVVYRFTNVIVDSDTLLAFFDRKSMGLMAAQKYLTITDALTLSSWVSELVGSYACLNVVMESKEGENFKRLLDDLSRWAWSMNSCADIAEEKQEEARQKGHLKYLAALELIERSIK